MANNFNPKNYLDSLRIPLWKQDADLWNQQLQGQADILDRQYAEKIRLAEQKKKYLELAESDPQALYSMSLGGLNKQQQDFFAPKFYDIYNEYKANSLKTGIDTGTGSKQSFYDYLSNYDWNTNYNKQAYVNRGGYQARNLAPASRYLNY
jgi:hypothetical protein